MSLSTKSSSLQLLPSALSTHREIWTHGLMTPPSGSPLYSEGDLSWENVIERLQHKERSRDTEQQGSNENAELHDTQQQAASPVHHGVCDHKSNATAPLEHDSQNRWLADLLSGKLERSWRSNSNGALSTYQPVQQTPHYPLQSTTSTQQLSHHAFEFVPNKRYSAPVGGMNIPLYADITTPPQQQKWRDNNISPMEHGREPYHTTRRRSHSGSPLSTSSSTSSSMSLGSQQDSSPPMRRKRRTVLCKFFLQGKCAKGDACQFSHNTTSNNTSSPSSRRNAKARVACKYVSSGAHCPYGENCLFNHNVDSQVSH